MQRLERFERDELSTGVTAYVFLTNLSFHRDLNALPALVSAPFGLGMPEFARPGLKRVSDAYRDKLKHIDAFNIGESICNLLRFPTTFDGKLPSEAFGRPTSRVVIGETYLFNSGGQNGEDVLGQVRDAIMVAEEKKAYLVVKDMLQGGTFISTLPMTETDVAEYEEFGNSYFGKPFEKHGIKDSFEMFEWLMGIYVKTPRAKLVEWFGTTNEQYLSTLTDEELLSHYCEAMVANFERDRAARDPAV